MIVQKHILYFREATSNAALRMEILLKGEEKGRK